VIFLFPCAVAAQDPIWCERHMSEEARAKWGVEGGRKARANRRRGGSKPWLGGGGGGGGGDGGGGGASGSRAT